MPKEQESIKEKQTANFIICSDCTGTGRINSKRCENCLGAGVVLWFIDRLLYWGQPLDAVSVLHDKLRAVVSKSINVFLIIFGILGFLSLMWLYFERVQLGYSITPFWQILDWRVVFFYLALIAWMYLYSRVVRQGEKRYKMQKQQYEEIESIIPPTNFDEVKELDKKYLLDVSKTFSKDALRAVEKSWELAHQYKHSQILPIHLFIALLETQDVRVIFVRLGIEQDKLKTRIVEALYQITTDESRGIQTSSEFLQTLISAYKEAYKSRQREVDVEELFLALVKQKETVYNILYDLDVDDIKAENTVQWIKINEQLRENWKRYKSRAKLKPKGVMDRAMTALATPFLDRFSQDLTQLARYGYLQPCVGRDEEIEGVFRILSSGRKSVILVGNPGVGKLSIIEGIAQRMAVEDVPEILKDKRLVSLSIAALVSGTNAAEAQGRLLEIVNEVRRAGNVVLFINDIQDMVGITIGSEESLDLSEILAKPIAAGLILVFATATPKDYTRYIEGIAIGNALEKVSVEEPDINSAILILEAKAGQIEYANKIFFSYSALEAAVRLSKRYIFERYLPEKAIKLIEEAGVYGKRKKGKKAIITADDIAEVISKKTKIPLTKITKKEAEKLLDLEQRIHRRVVDQNEAVNRVSEALRRARAELRDIKRPIVNLLFLGPTGVGKTELAKTVAEVYFGMETEMIRLDMSEYQEKASIYRLIGSPTGVGSGVSLGFLTEQVRKKPFSLLLLDELEKAHPDILNIFLQVMDDGRLTDNNGRVIDFTNVILIATSNAGTDFIQEEIQKNTPVKEIERKLIDTQLKSYFRPEFLNRFDGIVVFKPLTMVEVREIAKLMLSKVAKRLETKGIGLKYTDQAVEELSKAGFDPKFGARPLRRVIQEHVDNALANIILKGGLNRRDTVVLKGIGDMEIVKPERL